jgi:hypothetical protein
MTSFSGFAPRASTIGFNERYSDWERSYFRDATHVSETGGRLVTEQLMNMISAPDQGGSERPL